MSELLVPIAISSQLDITGEERVHAAKYNVSERVPFDPTALNKWWLTFTGTSGADDKVWFASTPLGPFTDMATRVPNIDPVYGMRWADNNMTLYSGSQLEVLHQATIESVMPTSITTPVPIGTGAEVITLVSDHLVTLGQTTYAISADGGLSWTTHASPGNGKMQAIARLASGRWLCFVNEGTSAEEFFYSDDLIPNTWISAGGNPNPGSIAFEIFSFGSGAFVLNNVDGILRTTTGTSWVYSGTGGITSGAQITGVTNNSGVWVVSAGSANAIYRATNNALTGGFTLVNMPSGSTSGNRYFLYQNGWFVIHLLNGEVFVSQDGLTWLVPTLPVTPGTDVNGNPNLAFSGI